MVQKWGLGYLKGQYVEIHIENVDICNVNEVMKHIQTYVTE